MNITANDFKQALVNKELSLNYQPIVNVKDKVIAGFEALMRWEHPEHGFISPGVFIPIAEESGLIIDASEWCLQESCLALKRIESRIGKDRKMTMSVNFTSRDFSEEEFLGMLYNIISRTDIDPSQIQLEVSRELLSEQPTKSKQTLNLCREAGLRIAIDNFDDRGNIEEMTNFPIDCLKIGRQYTSGITENQDALNFVKNVIDFGEHYDLAIVAEGVERKEEVDKLKELNGNFAQGYFFAKPMTERNLNDIIKDWRMPE